MNRSIIFAALIISAAILLNGFLGRRAPLSSGSLSPAPAREAKIKGTARTVAILPFTNLDSAAPDESSGANLQGDIAARLAKEHLTISTPAKTPRPNVSSVDDPRATGTKLGVTYVLSGSVLRSGDSVRVSVTLIDVDSGSHLWANAYHREFSNLSSIEADIAKQVAAILPPPKT